MSAETSFAPSAEPTVYNGAKYTSQNGTAVVAHRYLSQNVAVHCARYQYRGILIAITDEALVLQHSSCVQVSGASDLERPENEDYIGCDLIIPFTAVEIIYQPRWCNAPFPGQG